MLTSDKWRQARPRDLRASSRAVHLPQLKSVAGSSQERRVILQQQDPGEGRHSLCCGLEGVTGQKGKVGWSDASSSAVTGAEESERNSVIHKRPIRNHLWSDFGD